MPKKYAKDDVQGWSHKEVQSWLHSKGLTHCLPEFASRAVNGVRLLSMTTDDLKELSCVAGSDKKRKALKKAIGQLPGNSMSSKSKSKVAANKSKNLQAVPPPVQRLPPSSFEPVPSVPPVPALTSTFHPPPRSPQSPNSATYSDPSLLFPGEEGEQELYDNPADIKEEAAMPPHQNYTPDPQGGYEDDMDIYDDGQDDIYDSSFASEEEEEDDGIVIGSVHSVANGMGDVNTSYRADTEANIRAISAKFFAEGLTAHTGILTASTPLSQPRNQEHTEAYDEYNEEDEDIYDLPPEELKSHPPPCEVYPPEINEEDEGDIYDVVDETMQQQLAPPPPSLPPEMEDGEVQMIYDTAAADEEDISEEQTSMPTFALSSQTSEEAPPPRPPKPGPSPALPRKNSSSPSSQPRTSIFASSPSTQRKVPTPPSPQPIRPSMASMRGPIKGITTRPPIQQQPSPPLGPPQSVSAPPAPPPPPPLTPSSPASHTPNSGRRFPATNKSSTNHHTNNTPSPALGHKLLKPSEMKANRTAGVSGGGGFPVPGKFVTKTNGPKPPLTVKPDIKKENGKPQVSDKPMSVQERINMLKKPTEDGVVGGGIRPQKPAEGLSPCTGRKMTKKSSVTNLIKNFHTNSSSGGDVSSDGESRIMSPERKPSIPLKPTSTSMNTNTNTAQLKRRAIGQQVAPAPSIPERSNKPPEPSPTRQVPLWKKTPSAEENETQKPGWKTNDQQPNKPPWKKAAEERDTQPPWKKAAEEQLPWKKAAEEQLPWKKAAEERVNQPPSNQGQRPSRQTSFTYKPYKAASSNSLSSEPDTPTSDSPKHRDIFPPPRHVGASPPAPDLPPPRGRPPDMPPRNKPSYSPAHDKEEETPHVAPDLSPPNLPPPRGRPTIPHEITRQRIEEELKLPPRPPKNNNNISERPPDLPQLPPSSRHNFEAAPNAPALPQRPPPRQRPSAAEPVVLPPRPSKTQQPDSSSPVGHSWYHANLKDRKVAEAKLFRHSNDGTFIIRDSSKTPGEYSLSLLYHGAVKHLRIRLRADRKYVLGEEKPDEVAFKSVVELVTYHKREPLVLKSGGEITLRYECPQ